MATKTNFVSLTSFFTERNGKKIEPVDGVNYTKPSLANAMSAYKSDRFVKEINDRIAPEKKPYYAFVVGDVIGMMTLAFLSSPEVKGVYLIEPDPVAAKMINDTVKSYKLSKRFKILERDFDEVPNKEELGSTVLFVHPEWEMSGKKYLQEGSKVNDIPIEDVIDNNKHCSLIAIYLPPFYEIDDMPNGFQFDREEFTSKLNRVEGTKYFITPLISSDKWIKDLQRYIYNILEAIVPDPAERKEYVSSENMEIWAKGFTSKSADRHNNYEELETIGDALLKVHFAVYVFKISSEKLTAETITNLEHHYLSETNLSKLAYELHFTPLIRTKKPANFKMLEDTFESFFGALFYVSNNISNGMGYVDTYNMAENIFSSFGVDINMTDTNTKNMVNHKIFGLLKMGTTVEIPDDNQKNNEVRTIIIGTPEMERFMNSHNIPVPKDKVLGIAYGSTQKVSAKKAYDMAYDKLLKLGFTKSYVQEQKEIMDFSRYPNYQEVRQKYIKEGYIGITFDKDPTRTTQNCQLIAIDENGDKYDNLATYKVSTDLYNENEAKQHLLDSYLRKK